MFYKQKTSQDYPSTTYNWYIFHQYINRRVRPEIINTIYIFIFCIIAEYLFYINLSPPSGPSGPPAPSPLLTFIRRLENDSTEYSIYHYDFHMNCMFRHYNTKGYSRSFENPMTNIFWIFGVLWGTFGIFGWVLGSSGGTFVGPQGNFCCPHGDSVGLSGTFSGLLPSSAGLFWVFGWVLGLLWSGVLQGTFGVLRGTFGYLRRLLGPRGTFGLPFI